jgi:16S rRNA (guanine966-N2)-methyltransferase
MAVRLTGGRWRGRVLPAPVPEGVRPTGARAREAIFDLLGQELAGSTFLDLFGGVGLVALEAASRGAQVTVVDRSTASLRAIRRNVEALGAPVRVLGQDAAAPPPGPFTIVFLDPPWAEPVATWLQRAAPVCGQILVAEARAPAAWPEVPGFRLHRDRRYGDTALALYRRDADAGYRPGPKPETG